MENLVKKLEVFQRKQRVYNALPLSQKEREKPHYDECLNALKTEFEKEVITIIEKNKSSKSVSTKAKQKKKKTEEKMDIDSILDN